MSTGVFSSEGWYNIGLIPGLSINTILSAIRPEPSTSNIKIFVANVGTATHITDACSNTFTEGLDVSRGYIPDTIIDPSDQLFFPSRIDSSNQFINFFRYNLRAPTGYFNSNLTFNGRSIDLSNDFAQPDTAHTFAGADWVEIPPSFWHYKIPTYLSSTDSSNISITNGSDSSYVTLPIAIGAWIFIDTSNTDLAIDVSGDVGDGQNYTTTSTETGGGGQDSDLIQFNSSSYNIGLRISSDGKLQITRKESLTSDNVYLTGGIYGLEPQNPSNTLGTLINTNAYQLVSSGGSPYSSTSQKIETVGLDFTTLPIPTIPYNSWLDLTTGASSNALLKNGLTPSLGIIQVFFRMSDSINNAGTASALTYTNANSSQPEGSNGNQIWIKS